ncbi:MAG: flippase [Candidatus Dojkabacteria bacterium]|nr:flippase [Candidatus Dojkabacteria bacterium]
MQKHSKIIIKGTLIMLLGIAVKTFISMIQNILIGQKLGPEVLGTFTLANTIFQLLSILSIFGLYNTINRFVPEYLVKKRHKSLQKLLGTAIRFSLLISVLFSIITLATTSLFIDIFNDKNLGIPLRILVIALPFFTMIRMISALTTSFETTKMQALLESILFPFTTVTVLFLLIPLKYTYNAIPLATFVGYLTTFLIGLFLIRFTRVKQISISESLKFFEVKYLKYSIPIFINALFLFLITWFDTFALGYFKDSKEVGIYNATYSVAIVPRLLLTALNTIFFPTISRLISQGNLSGARNCFNDVIRILSVITIPMSTFIVVFSQEILHIFGKEFEIPFSLMLIFSIGSILNVISGPVKLTLNAFDKQGLVSINSAIALLTSIFLNIILTPKYGIIGAAISNTAAVIVHNYTSLFQLNLLRKFNPFNLKLISLVILGVISGIGLWTIKTEIFDIFFQVGNIYSRLFKLTIAAGSFFSIYIVFVIIFKLYNPKDKALVKMLLEKVRYGKEKESR